MPSKKSFKFKSIFSKNGSCGCKNAVDIVKPEPVLRHGPSRPAPQPGGETHDDHASTAAESVNMSVPATEPESSSADGSSKLLERASVPDPSPKIYNSFAVVKNSDDPYGDFKKSMIQMIVEREIYSRAELQQLLDCFLRLNPQQHHGIIKQAFAEIMGGNSVLEQLVVAAPPSSWDRSRRTI